MANPVDPNSGRHYITSKSFVVIQLHISTVEGVDLGPCNKSRT